MKFEPDKSTLKQVVYLLVLLALAPFAIEFVVLADFVGLEFAFTFMLLYFRNLYEDLVKKWWRFKTRFENGFDELIGLCMFQPRTYSLTATTSCIVMFITGTTLVACAIWLPAILMSSGYA